MSRRALLAVAGWLAAAAVATATGAGAVGLIDIGLTGGGDTQVLSPQEVADQLAAMPTLSPAPASAPVPSTAAALGEARPLSGPGGTVVAACHADGRAFLLTWTPAQGYRVDRVQRGPDEHADVRFENADDRSEVRVRCTSGQPTAHWSD